MAPDPAGIWLISPVVVTPDEKSYAYSFTRSLADLYVVDGLRRMALSPGTRLGPYEILAPIGAGGMGEVYRARDARLERDVAVKVLPASFSQDADRLRRFEQEAQAAGALNHPNITAVYDLGSHDGAPYIVTELLEGETLRGRLSGGALPVRKAIDYAIQIAKGLAAAHEKGIVHRDLKPENLFVTNDGRVKILDFGLAKLTQADGADGPQTNLPTARRHRAGRRHGDARLHVARAGQGQAGRPALGHLLVRRDPLRDAVGRRARSSATRRPRRCRRSCARSRRISRRPTRTSSRGSSGSCATASRRTRRSGSSRRTTSRSTSRRCRARRARPRSPRRRAAGSRVRPRARAPRAALAIARRARGRLLALGRRGRRPRRPRVPPAHVPPRPDLVGALRLGRQDDPLQRPPGTEAHRDLRQPARQPGVARLRPAGRGHPRGLAVGRARGLAPEPTPTRRVHAHRHARRRRRDRRRAPRELLEGGPVRRLVARTARSSRSCGRFRGRCGSSSRRARSSTRRRAGSGNPRVSPEGRPDRLPGPSGHRRRRRIGRRRGPLRQEEIISTASFASAPGLAWSPDGSEVWFTAAEVGANRSLRAVDASGHGPDARSACPER